MPTVCIHNISVVVSASGNPTLRNFISGERTFHTSCHVRIHRTRTQRLASLTSFISSWIPPSIIMIHSFIHRTAAAAHLAHSSSSMYPNQPMLACPGSRMLIRSHQLAHHYASTCQSSRSSTRQIIPRGLPIESEFCLPSFLQRRAR